MMYAVNFAGWGIFRKQFFPFREGCVCMGGGGGGMATTTGLTPMSVSGYQGGPIMYCIAYTQC